jgi:hypothetical protein
MERIRGILTNTKTIEGIYAGERKEKEVVSYRSGSESLNSEIMSIPSLITVTYCVFKTEEGEKTFPKAVLSETNLKPGDRVKIEQRYLNTVIFGWRKISEKIISS